MKYRIKIMFLGLMVCLITAGCGSDPALEQFKNEMDAFCTTVSEIDSSINSVDAESEYATVELLRYLDDLEDAFLGFAELDFPEEFDYLEGLADEAGDYMATAVASYHEAYGNTSYDEAIAEYAKANYSRAYKRLQIIISLLHGEEPDDVDLTTK